MDEEPLHLHATAPFQQWVLFNTYPLSIQLFYYNERSNLQEDISYY